MTKQTGILLVTTDPTTEQSVIDVLGRHEDMPMTTTCGTMPELEARLGWNDVHAVVADVDFDPTTIWGRLAALIEEHPEKRFIVLARDCSEETTRKAMEIGARYIVEKQKLNEQLPRALLRLTHLEPRVAAPRGHMITVLSAGGGCGATTIAVNLAHELSLQDDKLHLLVDLDAHYGTVGTYLSLKGQYGVADVMAHEGTIDPELIRSCAQKYSDRLEVLLSPITVDPVNPAGMDYDSLETILDACKLAYHITMIDAPRLPAKTAGCLASLSDATLLVFQLTVKDLRVARAMLHSLIELGIPHNRIVPVANRLSRKCLVSPDEANKALEGFAVAYVRNDFKSAIRGFDYGQTLSTIAPKSNLRRDIQQLAAQVATISSGRKRRN